MRIQIKGGVWKNTEDEILKAAVMKYGLNQWARISSLLVRKTAKQCKARWFEWLDPAIKKTEWTREEDEKLLHLAKLMPTQWRTIAPIVGRTPAQCVDRYERLLDMAVNKEERYNPADDPRRLRPGEIDPNPESKPARPDPVDMDEDEKEMLSEARARLANTRGKKAKRKAREKALEEARRLASLQKKRELKAAGIELGGRDKRKRGIDYNAEVAFERKPAPGFFDTAEEQAVAASVQAEFRPVTVEELEGRRRKDVEAALIQRDLKKQKLSDAHDVPAALARAAEAGLAMAPRRGKLMLPAPSVSDAELEHIARLGSEPSLMIAAAADGGPGGGATRQLLGEYGAQTPAHFATPALAAGGGRGGSLMLPPPRRTAPTGDRILAEAQNLAALAAAPTPLVGGDNPELHPSDFGGALPKGLAITAATPRSAAADFGGATPLTSSVMGPSRQPAGAVPSTPLGAGGGGHGTLSSRLPAPGGPGGSTPRATPLRDELGLNAGGGGDSSYMAFDDYDAQDFGGGGGGGAAGGRGMGSVAGGSGRGLDVRSALSRLPAPSNEYQFVVPEGAAELLGGGGEEEGEGDAMEEDAADTKARRGAEEERRRQEEERLKSQALQRGLPRPVSWLPLTAQLASSAAKRQADDGSVAGGGGEHGAAEVLLLREMVAMLEADAAKYPHPTAAGASSKDKSKGAAAAAAAAAVGSSAAHSLPQFELFELQAASELLRQEASLLAAVAGVGDPAQLEAAHAQVWTAAAAADSDRVESLQASLESVRSCMASDAKRGAKLEAKLGVLLGGLLAREARLRGGGQAVWEELGDSSAQLACFVALRERELRAAPERLEALADRLAGQQAVEDSLQERYKALVRQKDELRAAVVAVSSRGS